jgi:hypothetical protein
MYYTQKLRKKEHVDLQHPFGFELHRPFRQSTKKGASVQFRRLNFGTNFTTLSIIPILLFIPYSSTIARAILVAFKHYGLM